MDHLVLFHSNKKRADELAAKVKELGYAAVGDQTIAEGVTVFRYQPLADKIYVIDPGHGGSDPGAVDGIEDDPIYTQEDDLTLEYAVELGERLVDLGAFVIYTRTENVFVGINERAVLANNEPHVDAFISIHFNASATNKDAKGVEVLAYSQASNGYKLATSIRDAVKGAGIPLFQEGLSLRPDLGVLRLTHMPAVLVEGGFITNPTEEAQLHTATHRRAVVSTIVDGVMNWNK